MYNKLTMNNSLFITKFCLNNLTEEQLQALILKYPKTSIEIGEWLKTHCYLYNTVEEVSNKLRCDLLYLCRQHEDIYEKRRIVNKERQKLRGDQVDIQQIIDDHIDNERNVSPDLISREESLQDQVNRKHWDDDRLRKIIDDKERLIVQLAQHIVNTYVETQFHLDSNPRKVCILGNKRFTMEKLEVALLSLMD